jgi:hypothetical protein
MTIFNIHVEETDQTFPIPADIGVSDDLIKRALAGVVPYIDTAQLTREEKDGVTTIHVIKSHAPKGAGDPGSSFLVVQSLAKARGDGANPVAALYRQLVQDGVRLENLRPDQYLALSAKIDQTLEAGEEVHREVQAVLRYLTASLPVEAKTVPVGF